MIIVIDALNRDRLAAIVNDMLRLRARVFHDRLGWDVVVADGMERDGFDDLDPAYVVGLDEDGRVISCVRALQTTGPHMLADVFSDILDGQAPLRSSTLWESTRFCVDTDRLGTGRGHGSISHATCELMAASLEFARRSGIADIVTVIDPVMDRVLRRSDNAPYGYVGRRAKMGKVDALAALLDCTEERIARVRAFAGLEGDLFLTDEAALALHARSAPEPVAEPDDAHEAVTQDDVLSYCIDQLLEGVTPQEQEVALAVAHAALSQVHGADKAWTLLVHALTAKAQANGRLKRLALVGGPA